MAVNLLTNRIVRVPIVAVSFAAWLAISNHCALAAFDGAAKLPTASCHDTKPANHSPAKHDHGSGVECCKILRATLLTQSGNLAACDIPAVGRHDYVVALVPARNELQLTRIMEWGTGPPGANSFAESVLQRSLLAHAPPFVA